VTGSRNGVGHPTRRAARGAVVLRYRRPHPRATVVERCVRGELRRLAARAAVRPRFAPHQLRHAHALELAGEGVPLNIIQRSSPRQPRHDVDLPPGNRPRGDHRRRPGAARPDDVGHRRVATLSDRIRERERPRRSRFVRARADVCASTSGAPARRPMVLVLPWSSWCLSLIELLAAPSGCGAPRAGTAPLQAPCSRRRWRGWRRACPRRR
jgi:hypothetical protein